jgi:hypothetical protein
MPSAMPSEVPTMYPSDAPSSQPSIALDAVNETVGLLLISYPNVPLLNESEIDQLVKLTEDWFEEFYNEGGFGNRTETARNRTESTAAPRRFLRMERRLEGAMIRNMTTMISVVSQNISEDNSSNVISYNQQLMYQISPDANVSAKSVAISPFRDVPANNEYQARLMSQIAAFENVGDIEPPKLLEAPAPTAPPVPSSTTAPSSPPVASDKKTLTSGAIAGIAVGGLIILGLVGYAFIILPNELKVSQQPPTSFVSAAVPATSTDVAKDGLAADFAAQGLAAPSTEAGGAASPGEIAAATAVGATGLAVGTAAFTKHHDEETSTLGGYSDRDDGGNSYAGKRYVEVRRFDFDSVLVFPFPLRNTQSSTLPFVTSAQCGYE